MPKWLERRCLRHSDTQKHAVATSFQHLGVHAQPDIFASAEQPHVFLGLLCASRSTWCPACSSGRGCGHARRCSTTGCCLLGSRRAENCGGSAVAVLGRGCARCFATTGLVSGCPGGHITFNTSPHKSCSAPPATLTHPSPNNSTSHRTILHKCGTVSSFVLNSLANKTSISNELIRLVPAPALLNTREFGVGEAEDPGPATHDGDWTVTEQPNAAHRRINEAGDSVTSTKDSVTRAVQNLRISDSPAPPPPTMRNARRPPRPKQKPRSTSATRSVDQLPPLTWRPSHAAYGAENTEVRCCVQTEWGDYAGPVARPVLPVGTIRSSRCRRCNFRGSDTPLRELRVGGHLPGQTTARASGRGGQRYGSQSATP